MSKVLESSEEQFLEDMDDVRFKNHVLERALVEVLTALREGNPNKAESIVRAVLSNDL